jgi:hypothetical protein
MVMQEGSRTLIAVCRKAFGRIIEHVLRREGFPDFQRGDISIAGGMAGAARDGASEVFVLRANDKSAGDSHRSWVPVPYEGAQGTCWSCIRLITSGNLADLRMG